MHKERVIDAIENNIKETRKGTRYDNALLGSQSVFNVYGRFIKHTFGRKVYPGKSVTTPLSRFSGLCEKPANSHLQELFYFDKEEALPHTKHGRAGLCETKILFPNWTPKPLKL